MKRFITKELIKWKNSPTRKPLILKGARQVGKTYILNALVTCLDNVPNYFTFDRNKIDFIIQYQNEIIPIEVKSGTGKNHLSLTKYNEKLHPALAIKFSLNNIDVNNNVINIPLFLAEYIKNFITK